MVFYFGLSELKSFDFLGPISESFSFYCFSFLGDCTSKGDLNNLNRFLILHFKSSFNL